MQQAFRDTAPVRILVVDDDPHFRRTAGGVLSQAGYKVLEAALGKDGLGIAREWQPDLIVLDVVLPDVNGVDLCRRIKADRKLAHIPLVLVSGKTDGDDGGVEGLEAGADDYIARPVSNRELLARVEAMLRLKQAEDALQERTDELRERIKELNCLYGISRLVEQPGITLAEILQGTVQLLPGAWKYPDRVCARITLDGQEYHTHNCCETFWRLTEDIVVQGNLAGVVQVGYLEEEAAPGDGPFLQEEKDLLGAIAERLGRIIERLRVQAALRESEERYALAQRAAQIGSWDWDIITGDLFWSGQIEPMFGFGVGAFEGTYEAFLACVHPGDRQLVVDAVNACVENGQDYAIEHRVVWPDGTVHWVSEMGDVVRDRDGRALRMLGVVQDITERKLADQMLRKAKEAAEASRREEQERRQEADRRRRIAESLGEVLAVLNSDQVLDQVLDYIAVQARQLLGPHAAVIFRLEEETGTLAIQAARGLIVTYVSGADIPMGREALQHAMASRQPVVVPNTSAQSSSRDASAMEEQQEMPGGAWARVYRALLAVPIVVQRRVYGGMLLYYIKPRSFSEEEVELATIFGDQVALAIENAQLREQIREAAASAERARLARELHDAVTQTLFSAGLIAEAMPRVWERDPEEGRRGLEELRRLTKGAAAEMRTMLVELRPAALTEKPLAELLRHLTEAVMGRGRMPITLTVEGTCILPPDVQIALYRIAQESLNNVTKHAAASHAAVHLDCQPRWANLSIQDDGIGFDPYDVLPDQFGLGIMHERAASIGAELEINSRPGRGTHVRLRWQDNEGA